MAREKKQPEPEQEVGAPEWMVTFSDCMTLLLTFFVLLLSFSSFDVDAIHMLQKCFNKDLPSLSSSRDRTDGFVETAVIQHTNNLDKGSEKNALSERSKDSLLKETGSKNLHEQKVFFSPSDAVFWGNGTVISFHGRKVLSDMASFLMEVPDRIVVSENGPDGEKDSEHLGLQRAWAVIEHFTKKHDLDKGRFSIAAATLQKNPQNDLWDDSQVRNGRMLEIVLLERSIYN
jgi:chemotaxis protein MotB